LVGLLDTKRDRGASLFSNLEKSGIINKTKSVGLNFGIRERMLKQQLQ
jgi:hypothetical protein